MIAQRSTGGTSSISHVRPLGPSFARVAGATLLLLPEHRQKRGVEALQALKARSVGSQQNGKDVPPGVAVLDLGQRLHERRQHLGLVEVLRGERDHLLTDRLFGIGIRQRLTDEICQVARWRADGLLLHNRVDAIEANDATPRLAAQLDELPIKAGDRPAKLPAVEVHQHLQLFLATGLQHAVERLEGCLFVHGRRSSISLDTARSNGC
jgi:hypothetical protein